MVLQKYKVNLLNIGSNVFIILLEPFLQILINVDKIITKIFKSL